MFSGKMRMKIGRSPCIVDQQVLLRIDSIYFSPVLNIMFLLWLDRQGEPKTCDVKVKEKKLLGEIRLQDKST